MAVLQCNVPRSWISICHSVQWWYWSVFFFVFFYLYDLATVNSHAFHRYLDHWTEQVDFLLDLAMAVINHYFLEIAQYSTWGTCFTIAFSFWAKVISNLIIQVLFPTPYVTSPDFSIPWFFFPNTNKIHTVMIIDIMIIILSAIKKKKEIFPNTKEEGKQVAYVGLIIDSMVNKDLWSHSSVNKINKLKPQYTECISCHRSIIKLKLSILSLIPYLLVTSVVVYLS